MMIIRIPVQIVGSIILVTAVIVIGLVLMTANNVLERIQGKSKHQGYLIQGKAGSPQRTIRSRPAVRWSEMLVFRMVQAIVMPVAAICFVTVAVIMGVCLIAASDLVGSDRRYRSQLLAPPVNRY